MNHWTIYFVLANQEDHRHSSTNHDSYLMDCCRQVVQWYPVITLMKCAPKLAQKCAEGEKFQAWKVGRLQLREACFRILLVHGFRVCLQSLALQHGSVVIVSWQCSFLSLQPKLLISCGLCRPAFAKTHQQVCMPDIGHKGRLALHQNPSHHIPPWFPNGGTILTFGSQRRGWPRSPGVSTDWSSEASVPAPHMWHVQNTQCSSRPRFFVVSLCQRSHGRVEFGSLWCACSAHMIHHFP